MRTAAGRVGSSGSGAAPTGARMAHKLNLGLTRMNQAATAAPQQPAQPARRSSVELLSGGMLVRGLLAEGASGWVDWPADDPAGEARGFGTGGGGDAAQHGEQQQQQHDLAMANARFHPMMPSDPVAAHNAAHCEPQPGEAPGEAPRGGGAGASAPANDPDAVKHRVVEETLEALERSSEEAA